MRKRTRATLLVAACVAMPTASLGSGTAITLATSRGWTEVPSCTGPHDLLVSSGTSVSLGTQRNFDRICLSPDSTLNINYTSASTPPDVTLRVGELIISSGASIIDYGNDGFMPSSHDCMGNVPQQAGAGGNLTIIARSAIIKGSINVNGGAGLSYVLGCPGPSNAGPGGNGGHLTLIAGSLAFGKTTLLSATGGNGGSSNDHNEYLPVTHEMSGSGGAGGIVTVNSPHASTLVTGHVLVTGGSPGVPTKGAPSGSAGTSGSIHTQNTLPSGLPPLPTPLVTLVNGGPVPISTGPAPASACRPGAGALIVPKGQHKTIHGIVHERTVCVLGTLYVGGTSLTVQASSSIVVGASGSIAGSGSSPLSMSSNGSGRYDSVGGACSPAAVPHSGDNGVSQQSSGGPPLPFAGGGGAALRLSAPSMWIDGTINVSGGTGQDGQPVQFGPQTFQIAGAGGGSGGGLLIVAHRLHLGHAALLSALGGQGGSPSDSSQPSGIDGGSGCIVLATSGLDAPSTLRVASQLFLRPAPSPRQAAAFGRTS